MSRRHGALRNVSDWVAGKLLETGILDVAER
jgi:hypothetical protein